jgi:tellurite resistance protein
MADIDNLLGRVVSSLATGLGATPAERQQRSILRQAAASFARRPTRAESTIPTGFDPFAATLFEALVESAFLVGTADGEFDEAERNTFETVVHEACAESMPKSEVHALVSDLMDQLQQDGIDRRIGIVAMLVHSDEHKYEVLRIAALMAHISGGVHPNERAVMERLCGQFGLPASAVQGVLDQVATALGA